MDESCVPQPVKNLYMATLKRPQTGSVVQLYCVFSLDEVDAVYELHRLMPGWECEALEKRDAR